MPADPAGPAGDVTINLLDDLREIEAWLIPKNTFLADERLFPLIVILVPPESGPLAGETLLIENFGGPANVRVVLKSANNVTAVTE